MYVPLFFFLAKIALCGCYGTHFREGVTVVKREREGGGGGGEGGEGERAMPRSHLHVKPFSKRRLFAKWSWTWLLRGSYGIYVALTGRLPHTPVTTTKLPRRPRNCHEISTLHV